jgi:hypothetical protein
MPVRPRSSPEIFAVRSVPLAELGCSWSGLPPVTGRAAAKKQMAHERYYTSTKVDGIVASFDIGAK